MKKKAARDWKLSQSAHFLMRVDHFKLSISVGEPLRWLVLKKYDIQRVSWTSIDSAGDSIEALASFHIVIEIIDKIIAKLHLQKCRTWNLKAFLPSEDLWDMKQLDMAGV